MTEDGEKRPAAKYRHRGPRRATGGTTVSQGEPEKLAGFPEAAVAKTHDAAPGRYSQSGGSDPASGDVPDARGDWLREQRPPHWG